MKFKHSNFKKNNKSNKPQNSKNKNKGANRQKQQQIQFKDQGIDNNEQMDWKQQNSNENQEQHLQYEQEEEIQQQQMDKQSEQIVQQEANQNKEEDLLAENQRNLQDYQAEVGNKGVIYMSRVPPYMTPNYIRKLLKMYNIQRIYLLPQSQWARNNRIKNGGSKRICFREGWIQFSDKKEAKMTAIILNGQKMVQKKGTFYSEDVWNLKYLPKFKWHNLTQKLAHEERLKKQRLRLQMEQQRKLQQYYTTQVHKSKTIKGIVKSKTNKGKLIKNQKHRSFGQRATIQQEED